MSYNGGATRPFPAPDEPEVLFCANHPTVPTSLRCSRCGKPICAKCRVMTPVGYRCYDCAAVQQVPTYAVSGDYYLKALAAGLLAAVPIGVLWGLLPGFDFWAALAMGIIVGEVVSRAANMKRGPGLQIVGLVAVAAGIAISRLVIAIALTNFQLAVFLDSIPGNRLPGDWQAFDVLGLVIMALAAGLALYRLR